MRLKKSTKLCVKSEVLNYKLDVCCCDSHNIITLPCFMVPMILCSCQSWYSKACVKDYGSAGSYPQYGHTILRTLNQAGIFSRSNKRFDHSYVF